MMEETLPEVIHVLNQSEIELFIGEKFQFYLGKWKGAQDPDKRAGWNWAGFLGGIFWMGYRKMYLNVTIFFGVLTAFEVLPIGHRDTLNKSIGVMISVTAGMLGNSFYFRHLKQKIAKLKKNNSNPQTLNAEIAKAGGGSWLGVGFVALMLAANITIAGIAACFWGE